MDVRNRFYDRAILKSYDLGARTISVGNLTTGGTGKTPLVALIATILLDDGEKVCILTRGYGKKDPKRRVLVSDGKNVLVDATTGGDEPVELAQRLRGKAIIVADPDRVAAAEWARENFDISAFILDDAFQHRRARRDLDIVCIDATNPCGNGLMLPAGALRESFNGLSRADAIVITRTELVDDTAALEKRLKAKSPAAAIFQATTKISGIGHIEDFPGDSTIEISDHEKLFAFTGIGNPENFFRSLASANLNIAATESFRDHHRFTKADIKRLELEAKQSGAAGLVTTAKDAVKLGRFDFEVPCYVAFADTIIDDFDAFRKLILADVRK